MKSIMYKEEGVASAVGTIFAILIFVTILGIVITTYVPSTMMSYEEQYSENILNSMVQLESDISYLITNYRPQTTLLVPFNLASNYVPLFSTSTLGTINVTPPTGYNSEGSFVVSYSSSTTTFNYSVGGSIQVYTDNRYFVDQEYVYEFTSLLYNQVGSGGKIGSTMTSQMISLNTPILGSSSNPIENITITMVNLVGGPLIITSGGPVTLSLEILAKNAVSFEITSGASPLIIRAFSQQGLQSYIYNYINQTISSLGFSPSFSNGELSLSLNSGASAVINLQIVTILVSQTEF